MAAHHVTPVETPATTTAATTTTISAEPTAAEACYQASIAPEIIDYVDDGENQTPIPAGVSDLIYAVTVKCELHAREMLADGRREAARPVLGVFSVARDYSDCLPDTGQYRCGMLRLQYITAVNELLGCANAASPFDRKLEDCEHLASE